MAQEETKSKRKADSLFGQIAVRLGIVTQKQLEEALEIQRFATGHRPLGLVLIDLKYVTQKDLDRIIKTQEEILQQQNARHRAVREDNFFGKVAIRLGYCTEEQLGECLALQEHLPPQRFMRLGDIMVIKGYVTVDQVRKVVETQKGLIVYCPGCDTQYNVVMFKPGASIQCYRCGTPLRIPARALSSTEQGLYLGDE